MRIAHFWTISTLSLRYLGRLFDQVTANVFPCNIASSKHTGSWENTSNVGKHEAKPSGFPMQV